jgi:hypothetical protein
MLKKPCGQLSTHRFENSFLPTRHDIQFLGLITQFRQLVLHEKHALVASR